jgi:hypothetical protein
MPDDHRIAPSPAPGTPESRPAAEADGRRRIRITSRESLLRLVPILLGFRPDASVVVIGTQAPGETVKISLRCSLDDLAGRRVAAYCVVDVLNVLTSQGVTKAVVIGYGPDARVVPVIELFQEQAGSRGLRLTDLLRVEGNRYWSYACADPASCPPEGTPFDPAPDPELTGLLPEGASGVLASREALSEFVAAVVGPDAESMLASVRKAETRGARLTGRARAWDSQTTRRYPIALAGIRAVRDAICRYRGGESAIVSHDEAAWLLVSLRDAWVRDDAWSRMEAGRRQAHRRLWLDLTRLALPGTVAAPASLLAFVAWQSGNGPLASVALERALTDDPGYRMAQLLRRTLDCGVDPSKARVPMTPGQVAEWYAGAAGEIAAISRPWWP